MSAVVECGAVSEHGDVCGLPPHGSGLCQSREPRKHVSSPEKASKPWFWYREADPALPVAQVLNGGVA
jgi:hypothetical protein